MRVVFTVNKGSVEVCHVTHPQPCIRVCGEDSLGVWGCGGVGVVLCAVRVCVGYNTYDVYSACVRDTVHMVHMVCMHMIVCMQTMQSVGYKHQETPIYSNHHTLPPPVPIMIGR